MEARGLRHCEAWVSPLYQLHIWVINDAWWGILALKLGGTLREVGQFHFRLHTEVGRVPLCRHYLLPIGSVWQVILPWARHIKVGTECMLYLSYFFVIVRIPPVFTEDAPRRFIFARIKKASFLTWHYVCPLKCLHGSRRLLRLRLSSVW